MPLVRQYELLPVEQIVSGGALGSEFQLGNHWSVQVDGPVLEVSWYRVSTSGPAPTRLQLWRALDQLLLWETSIIPDNGAVGWQRATIEEGPVLTKQTRYVAVMHGPVNFVLPTIPVTPMPFSPIGFSRHMHTRGVTQTTGFTYPTTFDSQFHYPIDVRIDNEWSPTGGGGGITQAELEAELATWLADTDPRAESLVAQTHTLATTADTSLATLLTRIPATLADTVASIYTSVGDGLATTVNSISSSLATAQTKLDAILVDTASILNGINTTLVNLLNTANDALVTLLNDLGNLFSRSTGDPPLPAAGWTLVDEALWSEGITWPVAADVYVVTITDFGDRQSIGQTAGGLWYPRAGWWCPLNGTQRGSRGFIDFETSYLHRLPERLPGIHLHCGTGYAGTIQAWTVPTS